MQLTGDSTPNNLSGGAHWFFHPATTILFAALVAVCLSLTDGLATLASVLGVLVLIVQMMMRPWLGVLAIFPLAFSIRPAPPSVGLQEAVFACLLVLATLRLLGEAIQTGRWKGFLQQYGPALLMAIGFVAINLAVALSNQVELADWVRGVIPFAFILICFPILLAIEGRPERMVWLGYAILALAVLLTGHVVLYFLGEKLWRPYWVISTGVGEHRVYSLAEPSGNLVYPSMMYDRITMHLATSTDVLLPLTFVCGAILAMFGRLRWKRRLGMGLGALGLTATLLTYTRSMLMTAYLVICLAIVLMYVWRRASMWRAAKVFTWSVVWGIAIIGIFQIWVMWLGRFAPFFSSELTAGSGWVVPDVNVSSRLEEYRIAWSMFLDKPLLGNGLGVKHDMTFYTLDNTPLHQSVGYVHNWPLYMLMVGGLLGFLAYVYLLLGPVWRRYRAMKDIELLDALVIGGVLTMAIYALFFAVFRLVTFNLLLGAVWGLVLARQQMHVHAV